MYHSDRLAKTEKIVKVMTLIVILIFVIGLITFYEPSLYFKDRYLWYTYIGNKYHDIGKGDLALKYAHNAVFLDTTRPEAHKLRTRIYEARDMYNKAQQELSFLKSMNETSFYYRHLGRMMLEQDKPNESLAYFKKAFEEDPFYAPNMVRLGLVYLKMNDTKNAIKYLIMSKDFVYESFPEQPRLRREVFGTIHAGLGFAYEQKGEYEKANDEFKKAKAFYHRSIENVRALIS